MLISLIINQIKLSNEENEINKIKKEIAQQKETEYNNCLNEEYSDSDLTNNLYNKILETDSYLKKYSLSVGYEDTTYGFSYTYNEDKVYYAASTIKMVDAMYIYTKASAGEINLDDVVTYDAKNILGDSKEMSKYKVGDKVSLRNLVKYAVMVSDNTAHDMLLNYIGFNNLKKYGQSLGATYTLVGGDDFGEMSVADALIYLENLYEYLNSEDQLSQELKSYFINSDQNDLKMDGIDAVQKYGEYDDYYHTNGIVYAKNPYLISILTLEGDNDFEAVIRDVNAKIYELHLTFYQERVNRCQEQIYGQNKSE